LDQAEQTQLPWLPVMREEEKDEMCHTNDLWYVRQKVTIPQFYKRSLADKCCPLSVTKISKQ
jgi:hypothetical protein